MSDHIEQVFAKAIDCHQRGQLAQAEGLYRQVLAAVPHNLDALNLLGVLALQTGRNDLAVELLAKAVAGNDKVADFHNNMGEALRRLGRLDQAIDHFTRAAGLEPGFVEAQQNLADVLSAQEKLEEAADVYAGILRLKPDFVAAHRGLGIVRRRQGQFEDAVSHLQRATEFAPKSALAHNDLGIAFREQGRLDDAVARFKAALSLRDDFPEAHSNLGNALRERGQLDVAAAHLERAIQLRSNFPAALHNLALVHLAAGRHEQALGRVLQGLKLDETKETKALFVRCLKEAPSLGATPGVRFFLLRALADPWGRPGDLVNAAVVAITADASVTQLIVRAVGSEPGRAPGAEAFKEAGLSALLRDELLRSLLQSAPIPHPRLEIVLTSLRSALLDISVQQPEQRPPDLTLDFCCALARQCFINEYMFALTDSERERSQTLCEALGAALSAKNGPVSPWRVAAAASYRPLHSIECAEELLAMRWPDAVDALLTQQLREPAAVARCRASIPRLTAIDDTVSLSVRRQYEESPYPCWVKTAPAEEWATIDAYLRNLFPSALFDGANKRDNDILIAGCGTGQQSIEVAQRFPRARVLAVDLSLASLGYAQAKTEAAGLDNIRYAQADILKLGAIDRTFDVIETTGVLHHLDDPFEGWKVLLSRLRPGGFMRVGLYSRLGREHVEAARGWIAERSYRAVADDIRRCRQEMTTADGMQKFGPLLFSPDFASTSACRDLLFHVRERVLTLPEIETFLTAQTLSFLGFELESQIAERYRACFPDDPAMTRLDLWHRFEVDNPHTFGRMYQFWIQKRW